MSELLPKTTYEVIAISPRELLEYSIVALEAPRLIHLSCRLKTTSSPTKANPGNLFEVAIEYAHGLAVTHVAKRIADLNKLDTSTIFDLHEELITRKYNEILNSQSK